MRNADLKLAATPAVAQGFAVPGRVVCTPIDGRTILQVACALARVADVRERVHKTLKVDLPERPSFVVGPGVALAWAGPLRWLAIAEAVTSEDLRRGFGNLFGDAASLTDVSDAYAVLRLSGPAVRDVLVRAVPIDLHPSVFAVGDLAMTHADHIAVVLFRTEEDTFELLVPRTLAQSLRDALAPH